MHSAAPTRTFSLVRSAALSAVAAGVLVATSMGVPAAHAGSGSTPEGFDYSCSGGEATIVSAGTAAGDVVIPATIDDGGEPCTVVAIDRDAFSAWGITSVVFPDTLRSIGASAFAFNSLTAVTIPDSVQEIGEQAFAQNSIATLALGSGVTRIENLAFMSNRLVRVEVPAGVEEVGTGAFMANNIDDVVFGPDVHTIESAAFDHNSGLRSVTFLGDAPTTFWPAPESGSGSLGPAGEEPVVVFSSSATGFTTPTWEGYRSSVAYEVSFDTDGIAPPPETQLVLAGDSAYDPRLAPVVGYDFRGWYAAGSDEEYDFGAAVTSDIDLHARWAAVTTVEGIVYHCDLESGEAAVAGVDGASPAVVIPASITVPGSAPALACPVTSIADEAFQGAGVTSLELPDSLVAIGERAFMINDLRTLTIPAGVERISASAFAWNDLDDVFFAGDAPSVVAAAPGTGSFGVGGDDGPLLHLARGASGFALPSWNGYRTTTEFLVSFDTDGRGDAPAAQTVAYGQTVAEPVAPTAEGERFVGWYVHAMPEVRLGSTTAAAIASLVPYDFAAPVTSDLTLLAVWEAAPAPTPTPSSPSAEPASPADSEDPGAAALPATGGGAVAPVIVLASSVLVLVGAVLVRRRRLS